MYPSGASARRLGLLARRGRGAAELALQPPPLFAKQPAQGVRHLTPRRVLAFGEVLRELASHEDAARRQLVAPLADLAQPLLHDDRVLDRAEGILRLDGDPNQLARWLAVHVCGKLEAVAQLLGADARTMEPRRGRVLVE